MPPAAVMTVVVMMFAAVLCGASAQSTPTVISLARANGATTFAAAVQTAGLTDAVNTFKGVIFVPANMAFVTNAAVFTSLPACPAYVLTSILRFHMVPGPLYNISATAGTRSMATALSGQSLSVNVTCVIRCQPVCSRICTHTIQGVNGSRGVVRSSAQLGSSVSVLFIDGMVLPVLVCPTLSPPPRPPPPSPPAALATPAVALTSLKEFTFFTTYAKNTGLLAMLERRNYVATIFAPTDTAFVQYIGQLRQAGYNTTGMLASTGIMTRLLSYHIIPGASARAADLINGMVLPTLYSGMVVIVRWGSSGGVPVLSIEAASSRAKVIRADILAGQTMIHVVDTVLIPRQFK